MVKRLYPNAKNLNFLLEENRGYQQLNRSSRAEVALLLGSARPLVAEGLATTKLWFCRRCVCDRVQDQAEPRPQYNIGATVLGAEGLREACTMFRKRWVAPQPRRTPALARFCFWSMYLPPHVGFASSFET